jgi:excinuclease ABC subunit C
MSSAPSAANSPGFDARPLLASLPDDPGVYRMVDAGGAVLYVGKAKNLKKRVSSYFQKSAKSPRIELMLQQVAGVEITATRSEAEALILENTLIKKLTPKYNILFRDDKSYPYIAVSGGEFPRIAFHRGAFERKAKYFGPFPNSHAVRESIQLLQRTFLLRTCEDAVFRNRSRPCLLHQIHRCKGPCVGLVSPEEYAADVRLADLFLRGRHDEVIGRMTEAMASHAAALQFEQAAVLRDQVRALQAILHRQYVSSTAGEDIDVIAVAEDRQQACVNLAMVRGGLHLGDRAQFPRTEVDFAGAELLLAFIEQHYLDHPPPPRIIIGIDEVESCQAALCNIGHPATVSRPRNEMERAWLAMAENNARLAIDARRHASASARQRLEALRDALDLAEVPTRIECFDVSHTQGEGTVASCVVCVEGSMKKSEYRRFNIADITPGDDYAAMRQALTRRYEKVAAGEGTMPDLLLIDGGKGQFAVAIDVLTELGLERLAAVGVAKGEGRKPGLESLIVLGREEPLQLSPDHPALHLVQEIRDEAHRFAIMGHRARRAKARNRSELEGVPGIGPSRRRKLLAYFGGVQGVRAATADDLSRVDGISRALAEQIYREFH